MKTDIYQKLQRDFGPQLQEAIGEIEAVDAATKGLISDRIIRAVIYLSKGDLERLRKQIELARIDWRDVLMAAEYDEKEVRVRDFDKTFHQLGLL